MPATRADLTRWFDEGVERGASHMVVKCDDFEFRGSPDDQCCYPVYASSKREAVEIEGRGDPTKEVYLLDPERRDEQLNTRSYVFVFE